MKFIKHHYFLKSCVGFKSSRCGTEISFFYGAYYFRQRKIIFIRFFRVDFYMYFFVIIADFINAGDFLYFPEFFLKFIGHGFQFFSVFMRESYFNYGRVACFYFFYFWVVQKIFRQVLSGVNGFPYFVNYVAHFRR